jgi:hypothetical protein
LFGIVDGLGGLWTWFELKRNKWQQWNIQITST